MERKGGELLQADSAIVGFLQLDASGSTAPASLARNGQWSLQQILAAARAAAPAGGTEKVRGMIAQMVEKLQAESGDEAKHHEWCVKEQAETNKLQHTKRKEVAKLQSRIQGWTSDLDTLQAEVKTAGQELQELEKGKKEATKMRNDEKAENLAGIKEYQNAQKLIGAAVTFLSEFYEKQKRQQEAKSLLQQQAADDDVDELADEPAKDSPPKTQQGSYAGQQQAAQEILSLLEVAQGDFKKLEQEVTTEENTAANEYDTYMHDTAKRKAILETEPQNKSEEITRLEGTLGEGQVDLKEWQAELDKIDQYVDELNGACSFKAPSFEERAKRRENEIRSLSNALDILDGNGV